MMRFKARIRAAGAEQYVSRREATEQYVPREAITSRGTYRARDTGQENS